MIQIGAYEFFAGFVAFAGLMLYLFIDFKRDVRKMIEIGTKEHEEFRAALLRNDERFLTIYEQIGILKGTQATSATASQQAQSPQPQAEQP